jgi:hypothetical protein
VAQGTTLAAGWTSSAHWAPDFSIVQQQGLEREYGHVNGHYNSQRCWAFPSLILNFLQLRQSDLVYGASWIFANENICCTPPHIPDNIPDNLNGSQWISMDLCWSFKRTSLWVQWFRLDWRKMAPVCLILCSFLCYELPTWHGHAWPTVSKHPDAVKTSKYLASQIKAIWLSANKNCAFLCPTDRTTFSPHVFAHCVDKGAIVFVCVCQVSCMHWTTSRCTVMSFAQLSTFLSLVLWHLCDRQSPFRALYWLRPQFHQGATWNKHKQTIIQHLSDSRCPSWDANSEFEHLHGFTENVERSRVP